MTNKVWKKEFHIPAFLQADYGFRIQILEREPGLGFHKGRGIQRALRGRHDPDDATAVRADAAAIRAAKSPNPERGPETQAGMINTGPAAHGRGGAA